MRTRIETTRHLPALGALAAAGLLMVAAFCAPPVAAEEEFSQSKASVGAAIFRSYCASCHGRKAVGDGEIASMLTVKPANLTEVAKRNDGVFDIEAVKKIIDGRTGVKAHGSQMPIWGDAFVIADGGNTSEQVESRIDKLAHFIWSVQKK